MDPAVRAQQREAFREKNARRRAHKSRTLYAEEGAILRRKFGGAFGKAKPTLYNKCAEGTGAVRRAEHNLDAE
jgi:hypothetical protein